MILFKFCDLEKNHFGSGYLFSRQQPQFPLISESRPYGSQTVEGSFKYYVGMLERGEGLGKILFFLTKGERE